jgi:hypothetical protein
MPDLYNHYQQELATVHNLDKAGFTRAPLHADSVAIQRLYVDVLQPALFVAPALHSLCQSVCGSGALPTESP